MSDNSNEKNDINIEQALQDINRIVKIEKIHENDSFFDDLADDIEIEVRDVLRDNNALNAKINIATKKTSKRVFRLNEKDKITFSLPKPANLLDKSSIDDFVENIDVRIIPPKKKKLSAKEKERRRLNIMFYNLGRTIALAVMLFALGMIGEQIHGYVSDYEFNERVKSEAGIGSIRVDVTPRREIPAYPKATPMRLSYPEGIADITTLKNLKARTDDFKFWLYIDEHINYGVVQASDNSFYLKKSLDKTYSSAGSLFLDYRNNFERFVDNSKHDIGSNNIVYGHNMKNGSMFGYLRKFQEKEYFLKTQYVYTYSTEGCTVWKVFSAHETTTDDYYIQTYFSTPAEYLEFIKNLQKKSTFSTDIVLTSKDDILTLSTCHRFNFDNGRFVVHAVKLGTVPIN